MNAVELTDKQLLSFYDNSRIMYMQALGDKQVCDKDFYKAKDAYEGLRDEMTRRFKLRHE